MTMVSLNGESYRSRIGLVADSPNFPAAWEQVVEKVKIADELGFDSIWLSESWGYELFTSMADLIRVTRRIKIGAGIANIYSRTPALLASTVATLDERSNGRIILGLGASGANVIEGWHGLPFEKPVQRTREYIEIIRMILRGEKLVYQGEFFQLERGFKLRFTPVRAYLPIYVAAMGPKNVEQTGALADGVLPVYWPATRWSELRRQLDRGSEQVGRPPHSALIAPFITSAILSEQADQRERQAARNAAASPLAYYIGKMGVYYAQMLSRNGYEADVQAVLEGWKQGMKSAIAAVSPELLDAVAIVGTPHEIAERVAQWETAGVDQPLLTMPAGSVDEAGAQLAALKDALPL
ncbi:LLM class flavin-dependent oxidoreductase [Tengunoibacter tsumagoiensis]|uniref:LLM class F420-dependent oxidoreductase n=1 Tax=Tengunoibacter tsumagoiensis TaxID=2014871 RepID=A0A401ZTQ1_9CHLR|nr:LLM class flavin-dependent oxidoreductase [Tengunoibacter tsumagoiensis]GCE10176.1 LLM class F420-dependent oxidoreductase [Tengunoibacter tsumagoiensis]